jgi:hypothetical protein
MAMNIRAMTMITPQWRYESMAEVSRSQSERRRAALGRWRRDMEWFVVGVVKGPAPQTNMSA